MFSWFNGANAVFLLYAGCLYRGWHVRSEREKGACHPGGFRDGRCKGKLTILDHISGEAVIFTHDHLFPILKDVTSQKEKLYFVFQQVMQKDSEKNMSIKKLWK